MDYRFEFRPYHRPFRQPLQTQHGTWTIRSGIILRLRDGEGQAGYGEIAPLPWFGSESFPQALAFCHQLPAGLTPETIVAIPPTLPACQFGFESAWTALTQSPNPITDESTLDYCGLLPSGTEALHRWPTLWELGYRTFKGKIGIAPIQLELDWFHELQRSLPTGATLRLDANGGLSQAEASQWLEVCAGTNVEFIEQPLPPDQFDALVSLSQTHSTPIALDESVATLKQLQLCHQHGWPGLYIVKGAIAGFPSRLRQFCRDNAIDVVFSSVFETAIGRRAVLELATDLQNQRALGFGVNHWFPQDDIFNIQATTDWESLWRHLPAI